LLTPFLDEKIITSESLKGYFNPSSYCIICQFYPTHRLHGKNKTNPSEPKITKEIIIQSPNILQKNQSEFSKTGGIHASGLFNSDGELISLREDVGRHNALDKLIGNALINDLSTLQAVSAVRMTYKA